MHTPRPFLVRRVDRETADVVTLTLTPADGVAPVAFAPGQFTMLYLLGVGEVPISISGDPSMSDALVQTIRAVGPTTEGICRLAPNGCVGVRGPFGNGWPVDTAVGCDVVIVAGGIGLAPLRPVIYEVLAHRERYGQVTILYGARTPADMLFRPELERWRGRFDLDVEATVDRAGSGWLGNVGVVTTLIARARFGPAATVAYVCGPEVMMRFAARALEERGVGADRLYLSMERNMKCAIGLCGHCQIGPTIVCRDGPVFRYDRVRPLMRIREL